MKTQNHALRSISVADFVTLGNGVCGLVAVMVALHGGTLTHHRLVICAGLIGLGSIFDVADGPVAKALGSSGMGDALDSMCDAVTFGIAPAALLVAAHGFTVMPVAAVLVVASMLRLARYSTFAAPAGGGFFGLTMPAAAGAVLALLFLHPDDVIVLAGTLVICGLMVSEVRYPHQDRRTIPLLAVYWLLVVGALAGLLPVWPVAMVWLIAVPAIPAIASEARHLRA